MKKSRWIRKLSALTLFFLCASLMVACGGNNPAPAPASPYGYGYGGCPGAPGGIPISPTGAPYQAVFSNGGSASLNILFESNADSSSPQRNIVGGGSFTITDFSPSPGMSPQTISGCVSSISTTGSTTSGILNYQNMSVELSLTGFAQTPVYSFSPYTNGTPYGYPSNGQQTSQTQAMVYLGYNGYPTVLTSSGQIYGYVVIVVGDQAGAYIAQQ